MRYYRAAALYLFLLLILPVPPLSSQSLVEEWSLPLATEFPERTALTFETMPNGNALVAVDVGSDGLYIAQIDQAGTVLEELLIPLHDGWSMRWQDIHLYENDYIITAIVRPVFDHYYCARFQSNGTLVWDYLSSLTFEQSPRSFDIFEVIGGDYDGYLYFSVPVREGGFPPYIYGYNYLMLAPDGTDDIWRYSTGDWVVNTVLSTGDTFYYLGNEDRNPVQELSLRKFTPPEINDWNVTQSYESTTALFGIDGNIHVVSKDIENLDENYILRFDPLNGALLSQQTINHHPNVLLRGSNDTYYGYYYNVYPALYHLQIYSATYSLLWESELHVGNYHHMEVAGDAGLYFLESDRYSWEPSLIKYGNPSAVAATQANDLPNQIRLLPVYPNPLNSSARVVFSLPAPTPLSLTVYDMLGQTMQRSYQQRWRAGQHEVAISMDNWASGVYFVALAAPGQIVQTQRIVLIK